MLIVKRKIIAKQINKTIDKDHMLIINVYKINVLLYIDRFKILRWN